MFIFLGRFVAKAILDNRQLDLPLSDAFLKFMLGQELGLSDLRPLNPDLVRSLDPLLRVAQQKQQILLDPSLDESQRKEKIESLTVGGCSIDDLYLDFTLPGSQIELKPDGANIGVTVHNVDEYLYLVVKSFMKDSVKIQLNAFKRGFDEVFSMECLRPFSLPELRILISGIQQDSENWTLSALTEHTKCDHGYFESSRAVKYLREVMSELTPEERRKFLIFVTGSPRLPVGGWKDLTPKFTIVRKEAGDRSRTPDDYLPSVMTCFNYLKLPEYSSKQVLREKLLQAINEGAEFHLS
jgi:E3 ubiquitin-protein ligase TRIP12